MFKKADTNGDGNISWEEYKNMRQWTVHLRLVDKKLDSALMFHQVKKDFSQEDRLEKALPERGNPPEGRPNRMQGNKPHPEGLRQRAEEIFKSADKDGDGKLTLEEF